MANGFVGLEIARWLKAQEYDVAGVVVHPPTNARYADEIVDTLSLNPNSVIFGDTLRQPETVTQLARLECDIAVSVFFGYILAGDLIDVFPKGVVNVHPSYLPYNRGSYPNVWSILERTPAGVSLHYIDEGIDTGAIIARKKVPVDPVDTGATLYRKLEKSCIQLFVNTWPQIVAGTVTPIAQNRDEGTYHRTADVNSVDEIDLDKSYKAKELIDLIRARTFPPYRGAFFRVGGEKVYVRLELIAEDEYKKEFD